MSEGASKGTQARVWTEHNVTSAIGKTEYLYPETPIDNLQGQVYISEDQVTVENLERGKLSLRLSYENTGRAQEACIDVPLFYFPGYRGEDGNGAPLTVERGEGNLVRVNVSGRSGQVHVFPVESDGAYLIGRGCIGHMGNTGY